MTQATPTGRELRRGFFVLRRMVALRRRTFFVAVFGAAIYGVATVAASAVIGWVTDHVILPRFQTGHVAAGTIATGVSAVVAVALVKVTGVLIRRINATIATARIGASLRSQVVARYQWVPYEFHQRIPTGELLAHAGADVDAATDVLSPLPFSTGVVVILVVATAWLLFTDVYLAAIGLLLFPSIILINMRYQRKVHQPAEYAQAQIAAVSAVAHESFDGALVVKALGAEDIEFERFRAVAETLRDAKVRVATMRATLDALLDSLPSIAIAVLVVVGAWRVDSGAISTGEVVSFVALFYLIVWPLRLIGYVLGDLPRAVVGYDRIESVMVEPTDPRLTTPATPRPAPTGALALSAEGLGFAFDPERPVLVDVTFTLEPGRTVAVVGSTGCGKSTLILLLSGLLPPASGVVRYDGVDLTSLSVAELRDDVAIAFQESFLFGDTIRENILLGADVSEDDLAAAITLAGASRFISRLRAGVDTVVGERGATLSGGQRQRVALARALVRTPRLLLLDDATSAVDPTTEARILNGLSRRLTRTTTVVVANRPSTIALADEVLFLDEGRLVAHGTPAQLLADEAGYERLVRAYDLDREEQGQVTPPVLTDDGIVDVEDEDVVGAFAPPPDGDPAAEQSPPPVDGAMAVLRRGIKANPELREGAVVTMLLALVSAVGRVVTPVLIQQVIDHGVRDGNVRMGYVSALGGVAIVLVLLTALASRATHIRLARSSEHAMYGLRTRAFDHIHQLSVAHHTEEHRGTLVSRVTSDVETLSQFFSWGGVAWIVNSAMILAVVVTMYIYDWRLATVAVVAVMPLYLVLRIVQRHLLSAWDAVRDNVGTMLAAVSESVMGSAVIRGYGIQDRTAKRVDVAVEAHCRSMIRAGSLSALLFPANDVFAAMTTAGVVLLGVAMGPESGLTAGTLVAFMFLVTIFLEPVAEFTEILDQTQTAVAGWRKVLDVLDTPIEVADPPDGVSLPDSPPRIAVESVSFGYRRSRNKNDLGAADHWALQDVSITIEPATRVALVGATGSGKSTLAKLLVRFADPTSGRVLVDGVDLRTVAFGSLRRRIVLVPQETFLFDTTIAENVRFANRSGDPSAVPLAFVELGLEDWLDGLPAGLDTRVGERGEHLSVGERQLVALARAYVANPTCLLLDEATSAVDPATETRLTRALESLSRGRTSITIAHRLATAESADLILVIDAGRLVEQGSHAELLESGGAYAALHASWIDASAATAAASLQT